MGITQLADPSERPEADVVIYDGKCKFCQNQVRRISWLDFGRDLAFLSLHDARVATEFPDLTYDQMMEQMYVANSQGLRQGGADAVRYLSRRLPSLWPVMPILHIPGTASLWRWMYRQVAKRRYKIAGKACDGDTCKVHFD